MNRCSKNGTSKTVTQLLTKRKGIQSLYLNHYISHTYMNIAPSKLLPHNVHEASDPESVHVPNKRKDH